MRIPVTVPANLTFACKDLEGVCPLMRLGQVSLDVMYFIRMQGKVLPLITIPDCLPWG